MQHNQPREFKLDPRQSQSVTETGSKQHVSPQMPNEHPFAFAPQFAIGLPLGRLVRILHQNRAHLALRHIPGALIALFITTLSLTLKTLSDLIYGKQIENTEINPAPLFVLGHWRSGTTFLHELLSTDQRHAAPNGYQCFVSRHFLLSESWLKPVISLLFPEKRPMDDMVLSLDRPQEDEFALYGLTGRSIYGWTIFPANGPVDHEYLSLRNLDTDARAEWIDSWTYFLKSVSYRAGPNKRLILKSPAHTARIRTILEVYPKAKFIHIARDPLKGLSINFAILARLHEYAWNKKPERHRPLG